MRTKFHSQKHSHSLANSSATLNSQLLVRDLVVKIRLRIFGRQQPEGPKRRNDKKKRKRDSKVTLWVSPKVTKIATQK